MPFYGRWKDSIKVWCFPFQWILSVEALQRNNDFLVFSSLFILTFLHCLSYSLTHQGYLRTRVCKVIISIIIIIYLKALNKFLLLVFKCLISDSMYIFVLLAAGIELIISRKLNEISPYFNPLDNVLFGSQDVKTFGESYRMWHFKQSPV